MDKIKRNLGSVVGFLLIVAMLYLLFLTGTDIQKTSKEVDSIEKEIEQLNSVLVYLKGYERNFDEMMELLDKYYATIPEKKDEAEVISTFNALAMDNDLTMSEILFKEGKTEDKLTRIPFFIRIKGGYFELNEFIKGTAKTGRIYNMDKINVRRDGDTDVIIADIDVSTFTVVK